MPRTPAVRSENRRMKALRSIVSPVTTFKSLPRGAVECLPGSLVCSVQRVSPGAVDSTQWGTIELPGPPSQTHTVCPLAELSGQTPVYVRPLRGPLALLLLKGRYRGTELFHLLIGSLNAHKVGGSWARSKSGAGKSVWPPR